jgi:hypothetical protein
MKAKIVSDKPIIKQSDVNNKSERQVYWKSVHRKDVIELEHSFFSLSQGTIWWMNHESKEANRFIRSNLLIK